MNLHSLGLYQERIQQPLNRDVVLNDAVALSLVTERKDSNDNEAVITSGEKQISIDIGTMLQLPLCTT